MNANSADTDSATGYLTFFQASPHKGTEREHCDFADFETNWNIPERPSTPVIPSTSSRQSKLLRMPSPNSGKHKKKSTRKSARIVSENELGESPISQKEQLPKSAKSSPIEFFDHAFGLTDHEYGKPSRSPKDHFQTNDKISSAEMFDLAFGLSKNKLDKSPISQKDQPLKSTNKLSIEFFDHTFGLQENEESKSPASQKENMQKKKKSRKKNYNKEGEVVDKKLKRQKNKKKERPPKQISKSQTEIQREGSISSLRDIFSDHDDSTLTDSGHYSDSSFQADESEASSLFLHDPYAADSSEEETDLLFLEQPTNTEKGHRDKNKNIDDSIGIQIATSPSAAAASTFVAPNSPIFSFVERESLQSTQATSKVSAVQERATLQPPNYIPIETLASRRTNEDESISMSQIFVAPDYSNKNVLGETGLTESLPNDSEPTESGQDTSRRGKSGLGNSKGDHGIYLKKTAERGKHVHGSSKYMRHDKSDFVAEAEFSSFYPAYCSCCQCCVNKAIKQRAFVHIYENRLEVNYPRGIYGCWSKENTIVDNVHVYFFDRPPFRAGMAPWPCCCFLWTSCGPPVLAARRPWFNCCCLECCDCSPYFGEFIFYSPCSCYGCKEWYCCGSLCWWRYAFPFLRGLRHADNFLAELHSAVEEYKQSSFLQKRLKENEMVEMYDTNKKQMIANKMERE